MAPANLAHIDTWLFDLDNTLYPASCHLMFFFLFRISSSVIRLTVL